MPKKPEKDFDNKSNSNTSEKSSYVEVSLEKRVNSDSKKARYNKYSDDNEQREFFSKTHRNRDKKTQKMQSAKSKNKENWDITNVNKVDGEVKKTEKSDKYEDHTLKNIFEDFPEVDVSKLVQGACDTCGPSGGFKKGGARHRKSPKKSKKKSTKKSTKKSRKKLTKKSRKKSTKKIH